MDGEGRRQLLTEVLVGPHLHLYMHNAEFHAFIEGMVGHLPLVVDYAAQQAEKSQADLNTRIAALMREPRL